MKKIKIILTCTVSDKYYESDMLELKNNILSGKFQRDFIKDANRSVFKDKENNAMNCKVTFEDI
jgi:hypothetical protein